MRISSPSGALDAFTYRFGTSAPDANDSLPIVRIIGPPGSGEKFAEVALALPMVETGLVSLT
jgi:hypothetical protein